MNRRSMILGFLGAGVAQGFTTRLAAGQSSKLELPLPSAGKLPRWRGFNLLEMFRHGNDGPFHEEDFVLISELGFNFVRLPLDYRCWTDPADWTKIRDEVLDRLTQAVEFGQKHGVHVQLNFHRAPGYTVARPAEARSLWKDAKAQEVCACHWGHFARRFQGISNRQVSFNLFNEPSNIDGHTYRTVVELMIRAIREHDRDRLIVCDGRDWGNTPPVELAGLGVAAATRGYEPFHLTHYRAGWVQGSDRWPKPSYPLHDQGTSWDRQLLKKRRVDPWKELENRDVGVMVGEFGVFNQTPHHAVLPWLRDCLANWKEAGWGWALWNFRGAFGILDSERRDVAYESWRGHQLDRAMLELLRAA